MTWYKKSKHEGFKYFCDKCEFITPDKGYLTKHVKSAHEGENYSCNQCDYQSGLKSNLLRHKKTKHLTLNDVKFEPWCNSSYFFVL